MVCDPWRRRWNHGCRNTRRADVCTSLSAISIFNINFQCLRIGWPFIGDQPGNIAYLTHIADVAFTFYEARTGELGLKPILATGKTPTGTLDAFKEEVKQLLDDMAGEAGARKRRNVQKRKADLARSWGDGGRSRQVLEAFCAKHGL